MYQPWSDKEDLLADKSRRMPIIEIFLQATRSREAATAFCVMFSCIGYFSLNATQQTSSRLTWALARDNAFKASSVIGQIHPKLQVPVWALLGNAIVIFCTGCLYLASTTGGYLCCLRE